MNRLKKIVIIIAVIGLVIIFGILIRRRLVTPVKTPVPRGRFPLETIVPKETGFVVPKSETIATEAFGITDSGVIAVDRADGLLKKYTSATPTILYNKPITEFTQNGNFVAAVERDNPTVIVIIDVAQGRSETVTIENNGQVISAAVNDNAQEVYFLGNYSTVTREAILYKTNVDTVNPVRVTETLANRIEFIDDTRLLFYQFSAGINESILTLIDATGKEIAHSVSNRYEISKDRNNVLYKYVNTINVINTTTGVIRKLPVSDRSFFTWRSNQVAIIVTKNENDFILSEVNIGSMDVLFEKRLVTEKTLRLLIGAIDNSLIFETVDGDIITVTY